MIQTRLKPSSITTAAGMMLWIALAVALRSSMPWFFWSTVVALPALALLMSEREFLLSQTGRKTIYICAALLVAHIGWAIFRSQTYNAGIPGTYWRDDHNYFIEARAIAGAWAQGHYPEFWRKGDLPYLGTLHTGYHRPLSTIFLATGPSTLSGLLLNAICAATFPVLAAMAARYLWAPTGSTKESTPTRDPVMATAILTALHPNQFYWASYLMKDVYLTFLFLASMVILLGAWNRRNIPYAICAVLLLPYVFTIRIYTAASLIAGAACLPILRMKNSNILLLSAFSLVLAAITCAYTLTGYHLYRQITASFVALAPTGAGSAKQILQQIGSGIPRLFMAPYGWLMLDKPTPMYGLYPGMWYLYLIGYPLAFSGFYVALRKNIASAVIPMAAFGMGSLIFLTAAYAGNASRQRYYLEYVIILFAGYGLCHPRKWWIIGVLIAEAAFAIGQVLALK